MDRNDLPKPGIYRHFKGNEYQLLGFARHSETGEEMAVYRPLYGEGGLWVRPAAMWAETVERDGQALPRFAWLCESAPPQGQAPAAEARAPSAGGGAP